ncbi:hypothetical protein JX266_013619 [Neoarthrinium moseri]|nr:hypothetical protein JX266_013619 [Neoarthrinium moseri]
MAFRLGPQMALAEPHISSHSIVVVCYVCDRFARTHAGRENPCYPILVVCGACQLTCGAVVVERILQRVILADEVEQLLSRAVGDVDIQAAAPTEPRLAQEVWPHLARYLPPNSVFEGPLSRRWPSHRRVPSLTRSVADCGVISEGQSTPPSLPPLPAGRMLAGSALVQDAERSAGCQPRFGPSRKMSGEAMLKVGGCDKPGAHSRSILDRVMQELRPSPVRGSVLSRAAAHTSKGHGPSKQQNPKIVFWAPDSQVGIALN